MIQHCGGKADDFEPETPGWQFLPELVREAGDIVVPTILNDPFAGTDLQARLQELQPDRVLIAGWATDFCVDSTVRSTVAHHYDVVAVADGHTLSDRPHLDALSIIRHHNWVWSNLITRRSIRSPRQTNCCLDPRMAGRGATGLTGRNLWHRSATNGILAHHGRTRGASCEPRAETDPDQGGLHENGTHAVGRIDAAADTGAATAQDFPNKPIRLIVPFPAGGPNDIIARLVGQRMSELIKQPIMIDNRGGQGGVLGTDARKGAPDGYTIGIVSASALVINPTMEKVPYEVTKDFAPVTLVTTVPEMLVVASNVPAGDMKELVALAKAQPGKLNFASAGVGGLPHLAGELLKLTARIDIVHVPYRGAAPAINDLLGQQVQMAFLDLPVLLPHIKAGTLRPIALALRNARPPRLTCRPPQRSACPIS